MNYCGMGQACLEKNGDSLPQQQTAFCTSCYRSLRTKITDLKWQYLELTLMLGTKKAGSGGGRSKATHPPIPIQVDVDDVMRQMHHVVLTWYETLCEDMPISFAEACEQLGILVEYLYALPASPVTRWSDDKLVIKDLNGKDAVHELLALHRRAKRVLGS